MTEAYRIGIKIALENNISAVLGVIGKDLLKLGNQVKDVEKSFGTWGKAIIGVGALLAGGAILGTMTKLAEKAAEFQDSLLKAQNMGPGMAKLVESGELQKQAFAIGMGLGLKASDVVKIANATQAIVQNPEEAMDVLPLTSKYSRVMQWQHPGSHPEDSIVKLFRGGELSGRITNEAGAIDLGKVKALLDQLYQLDAATHGQFNPDTLLGMAQQAGGAAMRGLSNEGFLHAAIVAQMMGGHRAGTAMMSLQQQMAGITMKRNVMAMARYGLIGDDEWSSEGGHAALTAAASKRLTNLIQTDPMGLVQELLRQLEAHGITEKGDILRAVTEIFGRQTTQRYMTDLILAQQQINRETQGLQQGATVDAAYNRMNAGSITGNMQNLSAAWSNLLTAVGGPQGENFIHVLQAATSVVNGAAKLASDHPKLVEAMGIALASVAAALIGVGVVALGALVGSTGLLVGLGVGIATFVGAVIALHWEKVVDAFNGIRNAIASFIDWLATIGGKAKGLFQGGKIPDTPWRSFDPTSFKFAPGTAVARPIQANLQLNLDGQTLAQALIDRFEQITTFPTGAPAPDGVARHFSGDHNYSDT